MQTREQLIEEQLLLVRQRLEKVLPKDLEELRHDKFIDIEDRVEQHWVESAADLAQAMVRSAAERRAAQQDAPGPCVHCGSAKTRWEKRSRGAQREVQARHGTVVYPRERALCHLCQRSFSPSRP